MHGGDDGGDDRPIEVPQGKAFERRWDTLGHEAREDVRQAVRRGRGVRDPENAPIAVALARRRHGGLMVFGIIVPVSVPMFVGLWWVIQQTPDPSLRLGPLAFVLTVVVPVMLLLALVLLPPQLGARSAEESNLRIMRGEAPVPPEPSNPVLAALQRAFLRVSDSMQSETRSPFSWRCPKCARWIPDRRAPRTTRMAGFSLGPTDEELIAACGRHGRGK